MSGSLGRGFGGFGFAGGIQPPPTGEIIDDDNTFWVSTVDGNDSNNGATRETAWKTITKAAHTLTSGQTCYVRNGTYVEGEIDFRQGAGVTSNITLKAEHRHLAIISSISGQHPGISTYASRIVIDGFRFQTNAANVPPVSFNAANCAVRNWPQTDPRLGGASSSGYVRAVVRNCLVDYSADRDLGMKCTQDFGLYENNEIHGGIEDLNSNYTIFRNNLLYTDARPESSVQVALNCKGGTRNFQAYNNIIHINQSPFFEGIILGGTSGAQFTFDENGTHREAYNCVAYNNIILNDDLDSSNTVMVFAGAQDCLFLNNYALAGKVRSRASGNGAATVNPNFYNNLVIRGSGSSGVGDQTVGWTGTYTADYNNFYGYTVDVPSQSHPSTGNPQLDASYTITNAAVLGTGTVVATWPAYGGGTTDTSHNYNNIVRPGPPWNPGIY